MQTYKLKISKQTEWIIEYNSTVTKNGTFKISCTEPEMIGTVRAWKENDSKLDIKSIYMKYDTEDIYA